MEISKRRGNYSKFPLDVALTPFHLAMVFYDRLRIVCTVNQQLVYEDTYDQVERLYLKKQQINLWTKAILTSFRVSVIFEVWLVTDGVRKIQDQFCGRSLTTLFSATQFRTNPVIYGRYIASILIFVKEKFRNLYFKTDLHGAKAIWTGVAILRQQQQPTIASSLTASASSSQQTPVRKLKCRYMYIYW